MKIQLLKLSLVIIILAVFASSCDKNNSSSSSGGGSATSLALTNANISGTWSAIGNSTSDFTMFAFQNDVDFYVEDDGGSIETGDYTIVDASKIAFDNGDTLTMTLLTANNFNFTYKTFAKNTSSIYNVTTERYNPNVPTCNITSPSNGADLQKGNAVQISVDASSQSGTITEVKIFVNNVLKSTLTSSPYSYSWETTNASLGNHTIKAVATDDSGNTKVSEVSITLSQNGSSNDPPVAAFIANSTSIDVGQSVQFTSQSTNNPTSYAWDFGDGSTSTQQNPTHIYNSEGNYDVLLTVVNNAGSDTESKYGYITVIPEAVIADFISYNTSVDHGATVQFTDNSINNPTSWLWDFGDGNTSTEQNPSHQFYYTGGDIAGTSYYDITLTVSNQYGNDTKTRVNYISATMYPPLCEFTDFTASNTNVLVGQNIDFNLYSYGECLDALWDFGDGTTSNLSTHTYTSAGVYTVSVTGTDGAALTKTNFITVN